MRKTLRKALSLVFAIVFAMSAFLSASSAAGTYENITIDLSKASALSYFDGTKGSNLLCEYSDSENAMRFSPKSDAGAIAYLNLEKAIAGGIDCGVYGYCAITYRVPKTDSSNASALFVTPVTSKNEDISGIAVEKSYKYKSAYIDLTSITSDIKALMLSFVGNKWDMYYISSITFCHSKTDVNSAMADDALKANGVINNIGDTKLSSAAFDLDSYTTKYWDGNIVYNEMFLPVANADGTIDDHTLMYDIDRIISVRDGTLGTEYVAGRDYEVVNGKIRILKDTTRIGVIPAENFKRKTNPGTSGWFTGLDGDYIYCVEGPYYHRSSLAVTYVHNDNWEGPVPVGKADEVYNTYSRLVNNAPLSVVFLGDSITYGCNASSLNKDDASRMNIAPFMPLWADMTIAKLRSYYNETNITYVNTAVGGTTSFWGATTVQENVLKYNPDLVFIAFGANDAAQQYTDYEYKMNIQTIINTVRAKRPNCEFVLVSAMVMNPNFFPGFLQEGYPGVLKEIADSTTGVTFCDLREMHKYLLTKKEFIDTSGNNANHPNDFLVRMYAQCAIETLMYPDITIVRSRYEKLLDGCYNAEDYTAADALKIEEILADAKALIAVSETPSQVDSAYRAAIAGIGKIDTRWKAESRGLNYKKLVFTGKATAVTADSAHGVNISFDPSDRSLKTYSSGDDPYFRINYYDADTPVSADENKYVVFVYKAPNARKSTLPSQIFFTTDKNPDEATNGAFDFTTESGNDWKYLIVDLSSEAYWTGKVRNVRLDWFAFFNLGETLYLNSVAMFPTKAEASAFAARQAGILNGTVKGTVELSFDDSSDVARLIPTKYKSYIADLDGNGELSQHDSFIMRSCLAKRVEESSRFDLNGDGKITAADSLILRRTVAGIVPSEYRLLPSVTAEQRDGAAYITAESGEAAVEISLDEYGIAYEDFKNVTLEYKTPCGAVTVAFEAVCNGETVASVTKTLDSGDSFALLSFEETEISKDADIFRISLLSVQSGDVIALKSLKICGNE